MSLLHADRSLAARIDALTARDIARMAEAAGSIFPGRDSAWIDVAGGSAGYLWKGSPFNCAAGLGFERAVTLPDLLC
ncbi:MAG: GNAT family N-acetyltransferase, partial [Actinomycetota bacterium]|nr:GNAT family N-acetyltransferase [Actinomycetota bacterium]